jgi:hypothetical protein
VNVEPTLAVRPRICVLLGLLGLGTTAAIAGVTTDDGGHISNWRVARTHLTANPSDLDPDTAQLVADLVGPGEFEVFTSVIGDPHVPGTPATVLSFEVPAAAGATPAVRILVGGTANKWWVRGGSDAELVSGFFQAHAASLDAGQAAELIPRVLLASLYAGRATVLVGTVAGPGSYGGRMGWTGRFGRPDGSVEEVTAILPARAEGRVELRRSVVAAAGSGPTLEDARPDEEWSLVREHAWRPDRRYKAMLSMALLGQTQMKFRLANALLETGDPCSIAEGLKWLNSAAADGSRPAVERLVLACAAPIRPSRERDGIRMDWCDCFMRRRGPAPLVATAPVFAGAR